MPTLTGTYASPDRSWEKPRTFCIYRVTKKNIEKNPAQAITWVASAAARPLIRKIDSGTSGWARRCSLTSERGHQHGRSGQPADGAARTPALVGRLHQREDQQQHAGGDQHRADRVETARHRPAVDRPSGSGTPRTTPAPHIGRFTKNTHRQPNSWVSSPPSSTPPPRPAR